MSKDTSGPAFPADIPRINTVTPVASLSPASVTLDAIRRIVREEIRANVALEAAARQALEALEYGQHTLKQVSENQWESRGDLAMQALRAALKEQE